MAALIVAAAQLADLVTGLNMPAHIYERNPIAAEILASPLLSIGVKAAETLLLVSIIVIARRKSPGIALFVAICGTAAGVLGAVNNV